MKRSALRPPPAGRPANSRLSLASAAITLVVLLTCAPQLAVAQFLGTDFVTGNADGAQATGTNSTAGGANASAGGAPSTALGQNAVANGALGTAVGQGSLASGNYSTALGRFAVGSGLNSTATGQNALATAPGSTALGQYAVATGDNSTALGQNSSATGAGSTALGQYSVATGVNSAALGQMATASGDNSTALGQGSSATYANSTSIGTGAATTRANQMALGTASNTYTMSGITSPASTAAQSGPTQVVTSDAGGNLATNSFDNMLTQSAPYQGLQQQVDRNGEGVAMAIALGAGGAILPEDKDHAVLVEWGNFEGSNALGVAGVQRLSNSLFLNGGLGVGCNRGTLGGRAGMTYAW